MEILEISNISPSASVLSKCIWRGQHSASCFCHHTCCFLPCLLAMMISYFSRTIRAIKHSFLRCGNPLVMAFYHSNTTASNRVRDSTEPQPYLDCFQNMSSIVFFHKCKDICPDFQRCVVTDYVRIEEYGFINPAIVRTQRGYNSLNGLKVGVIYNTGKQRSHWSLSNASIPCTQVLPSPPL